VNRAELAELVGVVAMYLPNQLVRTIYEQT
jgi:hypothetical protein